MQLSPLNLFGIKSQMAMAAMKEPKGSRRVEEVVMYRCPECSELHDWEDDAEDCCVETHDADAPNCPVCGEKYDSHRSASDCCLWKDLDAPTRWKIADAVRAGATWADALGLSCL